MVNFYRGGPRFVSRTVVSVGLTVAVVAPAAITTTVSAAAATPAKPALACDASKLQELVASDVTITAAAEQAATATLPAFCQVNGFVTTQGPAPTTNHVNFLVALPDSFNGRYYYIGEGGSAGYVPAPATFGVAVLQQGFAFAGSDAGTPTPGVDYSFGWDRTKAYDWGSRGVHVATVATQAITLGYYGLGTGHTGSDSQSLYRYIDGCSGGGKMGNVEAFLYPNDYDGVIAGAPGIDPNNILFFGRMSKFLLENPEAWIPPATIDQLSNALLAEYDDTDGAIDGLIWDPQKLKDVDFQSFGIHFTAAQLKTLNLMRDGLQSFGQTYSGYTLANPIGWSAFIIGETPPTTWVGNVANQPYGYQVFDSTSRGLFGPDFNFTTQFSFGNPAQVNLWHDAYLQVFIGSDTTNPRGLLRFQRKGGKIIYWQGTADNAITENGMVNYYTQLAEVKGSFAAAQKFARFFPVPGLNHCGGGTGPTDVDQQSLTAITQWVEQGQAPQSLLTTRPATSALPARTFLLCPYPQKSVFKGGLRNPNGLDPNNAANWNCRP